MYLVTYTLNFVAWLVIAKIVFNDLQDVVVINPYVNDVSLILIIIFYFVMIDTQRYTIIPITISTLLFDAVLLVSSHFNVRIGLLIIGTIIFLCVSYYLSKIATASLTRLLNMKLRHLCLVRQLANRFSSTPRYATWICTCVCLKVHDFNDNCALR